MAKSSAKRVQLLSPENYIRQKARNLPVYKCLINSNWRKEGMANILIARIHSNGNLTFGMYMVDMLCLGIRDTMYNFNQPESEFDDLVSEMTGEIKLISAEYALIHNIIYAALQYAEDLGFKPHKDFNSITKFLLDEDTEDVELIDIECGLKGKPTFIRSESFTDAQANSIINQLNKTVGAGNFDYVLTSPFDGAIAGDDFEEDFGDEDSDEFDEFDEDTYYLNFRKYEEMSPESRKELFLKLTENNVEEMDDNDFEELNLVCESIFLNDVSDDETVDSYYDQWSSEFEMQIEDGKLTLEALGIESNRFDESELEELISDINQIKNKKKLSKKDFVTLRKKWGDIPLLSYYEITGIVENDKNKHQQVLNDLHIAFPDFSLFKIEILKRQIVNYQDRHSVSTPVFELVFNNRTSVMEFEMYEYQIVKTILMTLQFDDIINKLEAQSLVIEALELPDLYTDALKGLLTFSKINVLTEYFNNTQHANSIKRSNSTFQFKVLLNGVSNPDVWRRLQMPSNATFDEFHDAIQITFGWEDCHLYQFSQKGYNSSPVIELIDKEENTESLLPINRIEKFNAETLTLEEIFFKEKQTYTYIYDFGDNWEHKIVLEKIIQAPIQAPALLDGKGACPPEDCGGAHGYMELKNVLADKKHPEHHEMRSWLGLERGDKWDANEFDLKEFQEYTDDLFGEL